MPALVQSELHLLVTLQIKIKTLNRSLAKDLNIRKSTESKLNDLKIFSPLDIVNYHPFRYADYTDLRKIYQCKKDDKEGVR